MNRDRPALSLGVLNGINDLRLSPDLEPAGRVAMQPATRSASQLPADCSSKQVLSLLAPSRSRQAMAGIRGWRFNLE